jgi:D-alanyl-D-alanine carboxypeptidase
MRLCSVAAAALVAAAAQTAHAQDYVHPVPPFPEAPSPPGSPAEKRPAANVTAVSYLLFELESGKTVAEKDSEVKRPIASLTKMMTVMVALDKLRFGRKYALTPKEQKIFGAPQLDLMTLLRLALIPSNNHAADILARLSAGDVEAFARLMNAKAVELGMRSSHFTNASGLTNGSQCSTAADLAVLTRRLLAQRVLRRIVAEDEVVVAGKVYKSTLKLREKHPEITGVKTGYTRRAGRCLVLSIERPPTTYVLVMLGSRSIPQADVDAENILRFYGVLP